MNCPRCNTQLSTENFTDLKVSFDIDTCKGCGGTWFDKGELDKIDKVIEPTFMEIRKMPGKAKQLDVMYCPSCTNHPRLEKAEHDRDQKVVFDYCVSCNGIWLDKGELEAIQKENWMITIGKIFKWLIGKE